MSGDADSIDMTGAREVCKLLEKLDGHINRQDGSGQTPLYQAKERIGMLIISIDRSNGERVTIPRAS